MSKLSSCSPAGALIRETMYVSHPGIQRSVYPAPLKLSPIVLISKRRSAKRAGEARRITTTANKTTDNKKWFYRLSVACQ